MLQNYVFASAGLFVSYWGGQSGWLITVLMTIHVCLFGGIQANDTIPNAFNFSVARPLSLLAGGLIGAISAWALNKPAYRVHSLRFALKTLIIAVVWICTLVLWQIAPQRWWNYAFLVALPQLITTLVSWWRIEHADSWGIEEKRASGVVHWHFFVLSQLFLNAPFVIGQSVWPNSRDAPDYCTVIFAGLSLLYALVCGAFMPLQVARPPFSVVIAADRSPFSE